jgi:hypothetical protein
MVFRRLKAGFDSEVKVRCPDVPTLSIEEGTGGSID